MIRINNLTILLSSIFVLFFVTGAYAEEEQLYTTPYFQIKLPKGMVLSKIEHPSPKNVVSKSYSYSSHEKIEDVKYLFNIYIQDLGHKIILNKQKFLAEDVRQTYNDFVKDRMPYLNGYPGEVKSQKVKIGKVDFQALRAPNSHMATFATIYNGQFYRIELISFDRISMDMLYKQVTETLKLTSAKVKAE